MNTYYVVFDVCWERPSKSTEWLHNKFGNSRTTEEYIGIDTTLIRRHIFELSNEDMLVIKLYDENLYNMLNFPYLQEFIYAPYIPLITGTSAAWKPKQKLSVKYMLGRILAVLKNIMSSG